MPGSRHFWVAAVIVAALTSIGAAPGSSGIAPCSARKLDPRVDTNGASGRIYVYAILWNTSGHACTASGRMVVSLRDAKTRRLLHIVGNPHTKSMRGRLRPGRNNVFTLEWENYCGPGRPMLFEARFGTSRDVERSNYPGARCESASAPSRLRLFKLPR